LENDLKPIIDITQLKGDNAFFVDNYNILRLFLQALSQFFLLKEYQEIFSIAISDKFKFNFMEFNSFMTKTKSIFSEDIYNSKESLNLIQSLKKRWNLNTYFSLKSSLILK